jgi:hypothetical protein
MENNDVFVDVEEEIEIYDDYDSYDEENEWGKFLVALSFVSYRFKWIN